MLLHLISDLHTEFSPYPYKQPKGTDVVVAAGDITVGSKGPLMLREAFGPYVPIVYVAGNHEYYRHALVETRQEIAEEAKRLNVHFLDNNMVEIDGVVFIGGTLWTNFQLWGEDKEQLCRDTCKQYMNDYKLISYQKEPWKRFSTGDAVAEHRKTFQFIRKELECTDWLGRPRVVVTHMAPHKNSIHPRWLNEEVDRLITSAYISDYEEFIEEYGPDLWLHGHVHDSFDYKVDSTRIVCNPRGYANRYHMEDVENKSFNKDLIIEI